MPARTLLVVVPGIGGSVLADGRGPVWGDTRRRIVRFGCSPERLSVESAPELRPVGLMPSMGFCAPFRLHAYSGLVDTARDLALRSGRAEVLEVPYDFRLGVEAAADRLEARVNERLRELGYGAGPGAEQDGERAGGRPVVVVAHSMGGLVARHWLARPGQAGLCRLLITLGTPHRGASRALGWLVNGVSVGSGPVGALSGSVAAGITQVFRGWQAVYDLLPTYRVVGADDGRALRPLELAAEARATGGDSFAAGAQFERMTRRAFALHEEIAAAWSSPAGAGGGSRSPSPVDTAGAGGVMPEVVAFFARDHATAHQVVWRSGRLEVTDRDPLWQPNPGWAGDGTVPALSAIPPELAGVPQGWWPVRGRHSPMLDGPEITGLLRSLLGESLEGIRGGAAPPGPRLGVGLDDAGWVGYPLTVTAGVTVDDGPARDVGTAHPVPGTGTGTGVAGDVTARVRVRAVAQLVEEPSVREVFDLDRDDRAGQSATDPEAIDPEAIDPEAIDPVAAVGGVRPSWVGRWTPPRPGMWRVRVQAIGVPGVESLTVQDEVAVLGDQFVEARGAAR